jgi:integrase
MDSDLISSFKATMLWYVENKSASHAENMFERLLHFFSVVGPLGSGSLTIIDVECILNYRNSLSTSNAWYLSSLAGVIKKWAALGWSGVDPAVVGLLEDMRLRGNLKGEAVLTMDPLEGPLTDVERQALIDALKNAWAAGEMLLEDQVLGWLVIILGPRPIQLASLKVCDIVSSINANGLRTYALRVPRAKQRGQLSREEFRDRALIPEIGAMVSAHGNEIRVRMNGQIPDINKTPLFPAKKQAESWLPGFEWHSTSQLIGFRISNLLEGLGVRSERTGEALKITPTRLRRTLGTNAAMEGHGELVIADLLDHSDTQNAGVYVEARPEIVDRIDRAVAIRLAPLAQAFAGVLVEGGPEAYDAENPINYPHFGDGQHVAGACGKHGFCGLAAPIACYTCRHFQAWLDGPHEEILESLLAERERLMVDGSARIAAINDRTILAVAQVIHLCAERRNAIPESAYG